jgi:hypothetical protein
MGKSLSIFILTAILTLSVEAFGDKVDDLARRVEELEKQQEEMMVRSGENQSRVNSFLRDQLTIGGFFEPAYTFISGPNTGTQAISTSNILGLNINSEYDNNTRFVTQFITGLSFSLLNPHNDPRASTLGLPAQREWKTPAFGAIVAQGYIEFKLSDHTLLQGGMGYVPFGFAYQQRELVLFIRRGGPQLLRTSSLLLPLWSGLHLEGTYKAGRNHYGYNIYTTGFVSAGPGLGARAWWTSAEDKLTLGLSTQIGKLSPLSLAPGVPGGSFQTYGADVRYKIHKFAVVTEFAQQMNEGDDPWSAYVEPSYAFYGEEWLAYAHADYSKSPLNMTGSGTTALSDPYEKWEYGVGINWLPTSYTRVRLGYVMHDYTGDRAVITGQNRDYWGFDLSAGVAF